MNTKRKLDIGERPICPICNTRERTLGHLKKDGTYYFQPMCTPCKHAHLEKKNGVKYAVKVAQNKGCNSVNEYNHQLAVENGFNSYKEYSAHLNHQLALTNGFDNFKDYRVHLNQQLALDAGFSNFIDYSNSKHPYRKYRKDYCENIDGRFGFTCTTSILMLAQLDVDHIDSNARNNKPENLQTLCKCCHTYKTITEKDYLTPGRKTLGIKY